MERVSAGLVQWGTQMTRTGYRVMPIIQIVSSSFLSRYGIARSIHQVHYYAVWQTEEPSDWICAQCSCEAKRSSAPSPTDSLAHKRSIFPAAAHAQDGVWRWAQISDSKSMELIRLCGHPTARLKEATKKRVRRFRLLYERVCMVLALVRRPDWGICVCAWSLTW